jgi:putative hydrolase of the HAD superfamily
METILHSTRPQLEQAYWRHRHDYDLGVLTGITFWHTVASDLHRTLTADNLHQLLEADIDLWTQPNQPLIDWALALQDSGTLTGILSNMGDAMETGIFARFPWLARFPHHTFSHRLGIAKPDERIYRHAVAALALPAEQILFLDDRLENIATARAAGIHSLHYTSHDALLDALDGGRFSGLTPPARTLPSSRP